MITAALLSLASMPAPPSSVASTPEPAAGTATIADPQALVRGLAQQPPTRIAFAEARFSPLLERPLLLSGELRWQGGRHLQRQVTAPYTETSVIADGEVAVTREGRGTRHFSLDRAPPLKALLDSMVAVLSGDPSQLAGTFATRVDGSDASWTLTLTPTAPALAHKLSHIRLDGAARTLRCIEIVQAGGAVSIDLLGPLAARMPATPTRAGLAGLCRATD